MAISSILPFPTRNLACSSLGRCTTRRAPKGPRNRKGPSSRRPAPPRSSSCAGRTTTTSTHSSLPPRARHVVGAPLLDEFRLQGGDEFREVEVELVHGHGADEVPDLPFPVAGYQVADLDQLDGLSRSSRGCRRRDRAAEGRGRSGPPSRAAPRRGGYG